MKSALIDLKTCENMMIRCPHCNSWDRSLENAKSGVYRCEVCDEPFELLNDRSKDTVPENIRKKMDEAKIHNDKVFGRLK